MKDIGIDSLQTSRKLGVKDAFSDLLAPGRFWRHSEVLGRPSPIPSAPGVYAWYFLEIPPGVPTAGCVQQDGKVLLYVGISPSAPPTNGKRPAASPYGTGFGITFEAMRRARLCG
jgi:hypothetical protein